jgi:hypothetical protein
LRADKFAVTILVASIAAFLIAQQVLNANHFDPGIHPVTAASIQADKAAKDAGLVHLKVLASDDMKVLPWAVLRQRS